MYASHRRSMLVLSALLGLSVILGCSLPGQLAGRTSGASPTAESPGVMTPPPATELPSTELPATNPPAAEPLVVTHQGDSLHVYALDGTLRETLPASGLEFPRPNTAQVVGDSVYYVDGGGSGMGGVVRRVTASGVETLDFTAAANQATLTFAVSNDDHRIAWTHSSYGTTGVSSQLWIADIDGSNTQMVVQSDPANGLAAYFALEAMRWMGNGDLIYAWQVTGIGGYILFFGWSSLYRYSPADGVSTPLVPANNEGGGPCWYGLSPDGAYAVGGCGQDGMRERELATGADTVFPRLPDQGQQGAAAYSPSGARLAYAVARGNYDNEGGQVLVRLNRGEMPAAIASQSPGYFDRIQWADEDRMVVGYFLNEGGSVDLLNVDGTRSRIGDGTLIGLMRPPA